MEMVQLKVPQWEKHVGLLHGFVGRQGGKSGGRYASLNVSYRVGDDAKVVSQNVCDMKLAVGIHDGRIVTMRQVHGDHIVEVTDKKLKEAGEADGMITGESDVYLGVLTADCVPILFVAPKQRLTAAVHAGWRGTLAGSFSGGALACLSAGLRAGARGSRSVAMVVAPARPNADTMSTRCPAQVNSTAVTARG